MIDTPHLAQHAAERTAVIRLPFRAQRSSVMARDYEVIAAAAGGSARRPRVFNTRRMDPASSTSRLACLLAVARPAAEGQQLRRRG
jgi:hypothetical protein